MSACFPVSGGGPRPPSNDGPPASHHVERPAKTPGFGRHRINPFAISVVRRSSDAGLRIIPAKTG